MLCIKTLSPTDSPAANGEAAAQVKQDIVNPTGQRELLPISQAPDLPLPVPLARSIVQGKEQDGENVPEFVFFSLLS